MEGSGRSHLQHHSLGRTEGTTPPGWQDRPHSELITTARLRYESHADRACCITRPDTLRGTQHPLDGQHASKESGTILLDLTGRGAQDEGSADAEGYHHTRAPRTHRQYAEAPYGRSFCWMHGSVVSTSPDVKCM